MAKTKSIYILHIEPRYMHAGHYCGSAKAKTQKGVEKRVAEHLAGSGNPLVAAAVASGCTVTLARIMPGDRKREKRVKRAGLSKYCPTCRDQKKRGVYVPGTTTRAADRVQLDEESTLVRAEYPSYRVELGDGSRVGDIERAEKKQGAVGYFWRCANFAFKLVSYEIIKERYGSPDEAGRALAAAYRESREFYSEPPAEVVAAQTAAVDRVDSYFDDDLIPF